MSVFEIKADAYYLNGEPFRIVAGAMHYFRVHPDYWRDRMEKMRLMGLNTLETYIAWNVHEPAPGEYSFAGWTDLERYVGIASDLGLMVIVRPGPYICSEWEFGGLPGWLLKDPGMQLRCNHPAYIAAVERFYGELLPRLAPLQITRGGPIIMMQIENEYGSYGNDSAYLARLESIMREHEIDVPLFTSDGSTDEMLQYGTLPHVHKTVNFGSNAPAHFEQLRRYQPEGPLTCMEFWNGWFDHWGEAHHTRSPEDAAASLREIFDSGGSVCFYMFHGGTNFGFMNGANHADRYQPTITSYDDDAPVNEQGNVTAKFLAFREVLREYVDVPDAPLPPPAPTMAIPDVRLTEAASLMASLDALSRPVTSAMPLPMEMLDQNYGFVLYETRVSGPREESLLTVRELHDRGHIFVDGALIGIVEREFPEKTLSLAIPDGGATLTILVENMGRINYGNRLIDRKGITECVTLGQQILHGWTMRSLPLDDLSAVSFGRRTPIALPGFFRGTFELDEPGDSFLHPAGWSKGIAWINGFNLGSYWSRGPQQTLYVPGPLFRRGENSLVLLELDGAGGDTVEFLPGPVLDKALPYDGIGRVDGDGS